MKGIFLTVCLIMIEERATLTSKCQTTVPKSVRQVLGVKEGDQILFRIEGERVTVEPVCEPHEDPLIGKFLAFLAKDIEKRPEALIPISDDFAARMESIVKAGLKGTKVDLDAPIDGDVDL